MLRLAGCECKCEKHGLRGLTRCRFAISSNYKGVIANVHASHQADAAFVGLRREGNEK